MFGDRLKNYRIEIDSDDGITTKKEVFSSNNVNDIKSSLMRGNRVISNTTLVKRTKH